MSIKSATTVKRTDNKSNHAKFSIRFVIVSGEQTDRQQTRSTDYRGPGKSPPVRTLFDHRSLRFISKRPSPTISLIVVRSAIFSTHFFVLTCPRGPHPRDEIIPSK